MDRVGWQRLMGRLHHAVAPRVCLGGKPSVLMSASHPAPGNRNS
ncbi:putative peptide of unknwon function [Xanthomonas campestris pv. campestris]|uniref:Peptide of unknwon function n=1 Tax=Xanthomonas campestris pv. campestris (strain B100) TaxID=509169 RepID=B0RM65_XANCB|nr:putative peptide of unknwon function [Xanthomonas campestris pv. campestris]